jgi:hypothetical protein
MTHQEQRFASKVDRWYILLMVAVLALGGILAVEAVSTGRLWAVVILFVPIGLLIWNLVSTYYVVTEESLLVRCLLFRTTVLLASVRMLRASRDLRAAPALSMDRIEVLYEDGSVLVSPKDEAAFMQAIRARVPSVMIEGLPRNPG